MILNPNLIRLDNEYKDLKKSSKGNYLNENIYWEYKADEEDGEDLYELKVRI
jgi:hypothetical protein